MRHVSPLLLAFAGLGSGFPLQKIPSPVDSQGNPYTLTGACIPRHGVVVVSTSGDRIWQSSDGGSHWTAAPSPTGSSSPEFFGSQLVTSDGSLIWNGSDWQAVGYPAQYRQAQEMWMTSGSDWSPGVATAFQLSDSSYWVIRSTDSLRTWTTWLRFPLRDIPTGADGEMASYQDGRLWLPEKSSARWQVTSDGSAWTAVAWPDTTTEYLQWASGDSVVAVSGSSRDTTGRFRRTNDGGRTWTSSPLDRPGAFSLPLKSGAWITRTYLVSGNRSIQTIWVGPAHDGPWTLLTSARTSFLGQDDGFCFRDSTGMYRADLSGLASVDRSVHPAIGFELRRSGERTLVILDGIRPSRWSLAGADGSILASGVATESFEVPAVRGGAFLAIEGMGAKRLPPF